MAEPPPELPEREPYPELVPKPDDPPPELKPELPPELRELDPLLPELEDWPPPARAGTAPTAARL